MLSIERVNAKTYKDYFLNANHVFNSVAFSELNKEKCIDLHYLFFKDKKVRLGIILGEKEDVLCSPFSAPFGGFCYNKNEKIEYFEQAVAALKEYGEAERKKIRISLPPFIYNPTVVSKSVSALLRGGASIDHLDLNYQFEVARFADYESFIDAKAKNKLHNSMKSGFEFFQLNTKKEEDVLRAYEVIRKNREARGFPLRMTSQAVLDTVKILPADFFVMTYEGVDVAAAQIYHVTNEVVQVIYWGDLPEYADLRVMNYFSYKVFEHYYEKGWKIIDIGPSTENGVPNYGLCEFKENIGCTVSTKYTVVL
jgi:hypothetical protein